MLLEACVDSVESAVIATEAGADRLELCSALLIGGLTPTRALFREVRKRCKNQIRILIRPRFGDFLYSDYEFEVIKEEIKQFREEGADGVVIGMLKEDGNLDVSRMDELLSTAGSMGVTLHRAFDVCLDPMRALHEAISLGIDTILTSGQEKQAIYGISLLERLQKEAAGKIHLMAGSGVEAAAISEIYNKTGITHFHLSGKRILESGMKYRKEGVPMGLDVFSEFELIRTDGNKIKEAKKEIKNLMGD